MILYTPLCKTDIFPDPNEELSNRHFVSYQSKTLCVKEMEDGSYELLQLLSTDPQDFLDLNFKPGTKLTWFKRHD